jgi:hypothetical protein
VFLVKSAAAVVRLGFSGTTDDRRFQQMVLADMVENFPIPRPLDGLQEHLLAGSDPVKVLSEAFTNQARAYADAAARATVAMAHVALEHLHAAGGDAAVNAFLHDVENYDEDEQRPA